jgi:hypothetical protein
MLRILIAAAIFAAPASLEARGHFFHRAHRSARSGHYIGGHGSSHKGGHYVSSSGSHHYRHHTF